MNLFSWTILGLAIWIMVDCYGWFLPIALFLWQVSLNLSGAAKRMKVEDELFDNVKKEDKNEH